MAAHHYLSSSGSRTTGGGLLGLSRPSEVPWVTRATQKRRSYSATSCKGWISRLREAPIAPSPALPWSAQPPA